MLGYLFEQELSNVLPGREIAALVTRVEVDRCDPAFACPTKPIGPVYTEQQAQRMASERGWAVGKDGNGFRRVVASPVPRRVLELRTIELLLHAGHIVVCAGGGGLPVTQADDGSLHGVEAVVDKDRTAALLAELLHVDRLLLLTDVAGIYRDWGGPRQQLFGIVTAEQLRSMDFDRGSMGPKVEAACQFVERTGKRAAIGALQDATRVLDGLAGTQICHSDSPCKHPGIEELG
jgi:carbamate kinase